MAVDQLEALVAMVGEIEGKNKGDANTTAALLRIVNDAVSLQNKESFNIQEFGKKQAAEAAAVTFQAMLESLTGIESSMLKSKPGDGPASVEEERAVINAMNPMQQLMKAGLDSGLQASQLGNAVSMLPVGQQQGVQNSLSKLPDVTCDFVDSLPTMIQYDKKNLAKAGIGMGAAAIGVGLLVFALTASNPVGWCLLGGAILAFGISMAAKAIKSHKDEMQHRADEGLEVTNPLEVGMDALNEKKNSMINSLPGHAQGVAHKAAELAQTEGFKQLLNHVKPKTKPTH
ncbi:MAG: hypothetical protein HOI53_03835 [Francisellaceae bacterium]|jgi:hypothetical protein|nr:hypothetical protein [Francisellaceae bacterium]MBT6207133.1 hypothetical protein [Francisellaceae bacterium]MBT6539308.1 hypothetical protein [Francisellaceae bacterium]